jgi:hypothetical protein
MATPQNDGPSRIIESISRFAGTLVGTVVLAGKQIIHLIVSPSEVPSDKLEKKTSRVRSQTKKKAVRKKKIKTPKTKKKKAIKRKPADSTGKGGASKKKRAQPSAIKKKAVTPGKKPTHRKANKAAKTKISSHSQDGLTSNFSSPSDFVNV